MPSPSATPGPVMTAQDRDMIQMEIDQDLDRRNSLPIPSTNGLAPLSSTHSQKEPLASTSSSSSSSQTAAGPMTTSSTPSSSNAPTAGSALVSPLSPADLFGSSPAPPDLTSVPEDGQIGLRHLDGSASPLSPPSQQENDAAASGSRLAPLLPSQETTINPPAQPTSSLGAAGLASSQLAQQASSSSLKPLPGLPPPNNAEQTFLPLGTTAGTSSSTPPGTIPRNSPLTQDVPSQHIPRPVGSRAPSSATSAQQPPITPKGIKTNVDRFDSPMSPPDADPGRTMAESNRSSIDDIRRMHAQRKGGRPEEAYQNYEGSSRSAGPSSQRRTSHSSSDAARPANVAPEPRPGLRAEPSDRWRQDRSRPASVGLDAASIMTKDTSSAGESDRQRERDKERRSRRTLGDYALGKTLGAGSMGKVKLGVKMGSGEKVAIKIIPRHTSVAAAFHPRPGSDGKLPPPPTESFLGKAAAKDHSKEVRTIREGSLQILLHHPYVCGMREMIIHPNHYYMIFEYINGGQMLDYIISHGRLRERAARKFARQIGSALEYCHRNSIVHRDLKIENILISKTGNIKIIDFGLSNLFSPHSHLSTFCGSLYFAAPELLNAKVYTGPEVDVWSFGIVLYVLVCGKVPFDDQSMPALHAKIKKGHVEYPAWLSGECKHILSRMLVTDPSKRAPLSEILSHSWMTKGYDSAPDAHLVDRKPLRPGQLNPEVIRGMTGFEFGVPDEIEQRLTEVLTSDGYQSILQAWDSRHSPSPTRSINGLSDGSSLNRASTRASIDSKTKTSSKRFSGIDFYKKKISVFGSRDDSGSSTTLNGQGANGTLTPGGPAGGKEPLDPTRGYHPLISIYYLVAEKMDRERLYGHSFFASSNASLMQAQGQPVVASASAAVMRASNTHSGTSSMPTAADIPQEALRLPEASHVGQFRGPEPMLKEVSAPPRTATGAKPTTPSATPVFDSREKSKPLPNMAGPPRARANGDEIEAALRGQGLAPSPSPWSPPVSAAGSAFGRSSSSTQPLSAASNMNRSASMSAGKPKASLNEPGAQPAYPSSRRDRKSVSPDNRRSLQIPPTSSSGNDSPNASATASSLVRRFGSLLGRSPSSSHDAEARERRRAQKLSAAGAAPPNSSARRSGALDGGVDESAERLNALALAEAEEHPTAQDEAEDVPISSADGVTVKRSGTVPTLSAFGRGRDSGSQGPDSPRGHSTMRHASGAAVSPQGRRPTTQLFSDAEAEKVGAQAGNDTNGGWRGPTSIEAQAVLAAKSAREGAFSSRPAQPGSAMTAKPVFLKGLFSVQTTSTKPRTVINDDLVKVLDRLGVQYREIRGGYECVHLPSISFGAAESDSTPGQGNARIAVDSTGAAVGGGGAGDVGPETAGLDDSGLIRPSPPRRKQSRLSVLSGFRERRRESMQGGPSSTAAQSAEAEGPVSPSHAQKGDQSQDSSLLALDAADESRLTAENGTPTKGGIAVPRSPRQRTDSLGAPAFFQASSPVSAPLGAGGSNGSPPPPALPSKTPNNATEPLGASSAPPTGTSSTSVPPTDMIVRFEVFVVKVPLLLGVNGLQFRRVAGNPWQYQMLAKRVLQELKL